MKDTKTTYMKVGNRVRITHTTDELKGKEGEILENDGHYATIKLDDGETVTRYLPSLLDIDFGLDF